MLLLEHKSLVAEVLHNLVLNKYLWEAFLSSCSFVRNSIYFVPLDITFALLLSYLSQP